MGLCDNLLKMYEQSQLNEAKQVNSINRQVNRHGIDVAIGKAQSYANGLTRATRENPVEAKANRRALHLECLGSIDGQRMMKNGRQGFSITSMAIHLLEGAQSFVDFHHTRQFPMEQEVDANGNRYLVPGIRAK